MLAIKLILTPIFIGTVSLAGRRWGPTVSGLLMGLPLTSGPISVFLAIQYGQVFAAQAATGNLAGQASVCIFCLVYYLASRKFTWPVCVVTGILAFLASVVFFDQFTWGLFSALALIVAIITVVYLSIPRTAVANGASHTPRWDLPARMIIASLFVVVLTSVANALGPQLSGLLSPFPVFALVLAAFTQHQQGPQAAAKMLSSVVIGSLAYTTFFLIVGMFLTRLDMGWTYLLASIIAVAVSGLIYRLAHS